MKAPKEFIYFVNEQDEPTGEVSEKLAAHHAHTKLHAAFSCYLFNQKGEVLVTQRAADKKVWPGVWTNSCCGHPAPGESRQSAIARRLEYELGMSVNELTLLIPDYIYKTPPYNGIIEHEYCPIFIALSSSEPKLNPKEVADYVWMSWGEYVATVGEDSDDYTYFANKTDMSPPANVPRWSWWCKDQTSKIISDIKLTKRLQSFIS